MNIVAGIKVLLTEAGVTTPIKLDRMPAEPDTVIMVKDTGGVEPDANDTSTIDRYYKTFQIIVRAPEFTTGEAIAKDVRSALINRVNVGAENVLFESIMMLGEFQSIGRDDNGRQEFSANFKTKALDYEGTGYVPEAQSTQPMRTVFLDEVQDVNAPSPTDGQALVYDATNSEWVPATIDTNIVWGEITGALADQTDLLAALNAKATPADITAAINALIDTAPGTLNTLDELAAALGDDPNFASTIVGQLATKAALVHSHAIADVTGLQTALDGKAASSHTHAIANVTGLQTALDGKSATGHSHAIADTTGLQTALDGKASSVHGHTIGDTTGLQTALDGKAAAAHTHDDRYYTETEMDAALATKSPTSHNHDAAYYTKAQVDAKVATAVAIAVVM